MHRRQAAAVTVVVLGVTAVGLLVHHLGAIDAGYQQLRRTGLETPAQVVDRRTYAKVSIWSVEYTSGGNTYRGSVQCDLLCFDEGQSIVIYVDREDPTRFITESGRASTSSANVLWGVVVVAVMAAIFAVGYLVRSWIVSPTR